MIPIQDVLDDRFFYRMAGCDQPSGRTTSQMLWNPADSPVVIALRQSFLWSSNGTEFNMKWRDSGHGPHGVMHDFCRSLALKANGQPTSSHARSYKDEVGLVGKMPDTAGYVLYAFDRQAADVQLSPPPVLYPGTGLFVFPDTFSAIKWTWACTYEELPLPV